MLLSLFVLIGNPLIVMAIMGGMGYRKRTGFLAGLTVAQISEFSIVFIAMGIGLGHIGVEALGVTTLVGIVTITLSTYMILYSQPLYRLLAPVLGVFERRTPFREIAAEAQISADLHPQVLVLGLGRYGLRLAKRLSAAELRVLGVDCDPDLVRTLAQEALPVCFGDGHDPAFLDTLPLDGLQWVISTLPDIDSNRMLLQALGGAPLQRRDRRGGARRGARRQALARRARRSSSTRSAMRSISPLTTSSISSANAPPKDVRRLAEERVPSTNSAEGERKDKQVRYEL